MMSAFLRKARQLIDDPILRRWLLHAVLNRSGASGFRPNHPPYLNDIPLPLTAERPAPHGREILRKTAPAQPLKSVSLALPAGPAHLEPGEAETLFDRQFSDIERQLAVYRFAWLPLTDVDFDRGWVEALWREFSKRFSQPDGTWAWHPYCVAERAINILDYARHHGLPGEPSETLTFLARHAAAITARLEYFGEHNTSNHLSNNGRGLYRIGLALGLPAATEVGKRILLTEAKRIFLPSGVLREGSSHYHFLLTRNYVDAFLAAKRHGCPEAEALAEIARRALGVCAQLRLPGGLPLVGDISPDCPPDFLLDLLGGQRTGWTKLLSPEDHEAFVTLSREATANGRLDKDGWIRIEKDPWSVLFHVAPDGWLPMPGHAHQDIGSFEAHYGQTRLFVDPGRGSYERPSELDDDVSAAAHNNLTVDGQEPYPPNKPYYTERFRRSVCLSSPQWVQSDERLSLSLPGFSRLPGLSGVERDLELSTNGLLIQDRIEGQDNHAVVRRLHCPWPVERIGPAFEMRSPAGTFRITADGELSATQGRYWFAYGVSRPMTTLSASWRGALPAHLEIRVEPI